MKTVTGIILSVVFTTASSLAIASTITIKNKVRNYMDPTGRTGKLTVFLNQRTYKMIFARRIRGKVRVARLKIRGRIKPGMDNFIGYEQGQQTLELASKQVSKACLSVLARARQGDVVTLSGQIRGYKNRGQLDLSRSYIRCALK